MKKTNTKRIRFWGLSILAIFMLWGGFFFTKSFDKAIAIMSAQRLKGTVIVIDPGHGGKDPGARSGSIDEDGINLEISLKLREILTSAGATVIMTRDEDYDLASESATNIKREDMQQRAEVLNQDNVTLFISIHGNISLDQSCSGAEAYYRQGDENSKNLATCILNRLKTVTGSRFQPKKGDFYLLNQTQTLGVLIEVGFLSNPSDLKRMQQASYQEELAYGIFEGINDFLKILQ